MVTIFRVKEVLRMLFKFTWNVICMTVKINLCYFIH